MKKADLALVMPVYNEAECIEAVVTEWDQTFIKLGISYKLLVYNDGSKDNTAGVLSRFAGSRTVQVINKTNSGHGPTILRGYRDAVECAEWVFQCDSDGEMLPEAFPALWERREQYDALFGYRDGRIQAKGRALISAVSRCAVRMLYGTGVKDVNTPYRLMRAEILKDIISGIPEDTFAPNVIVSGEFNRRKCRIYNTPVPHRHRRTGQVSIVKWKLWKAAVKSLTQVASHRFFHR